MNELTPDNLISVNVGFTSKWYELATGQKWIFKNKQIEIHDNRGKIRAFHKKSIRFARTANEIILSPFL